MSDEKGNMLETFFKYTDGKVPREKLIAMMLLIIGVIGAGWLFNSIVENIDETTEYMWPVAIAFLIFIVVLSGMIFALAFRYFFLSQKNHNKPETDASAEEEAAATSAATFMNRRRDDSRARKNKNVAPSHAASIQSGDNVHVGSQGNSRVEKSMSGSVTTYIVRNNNAERDKKFIDINANVHKTYCVLGPSLKKISADDSFFNDLASRKIQIRLCTANARMLINDACKEEIENGSCLALSKWHKEGEREFFINVNELYEEAKKGRPESSKLMDERHILIEESHLDEYFSTMTSYKKGMENAKRDLEDMRRKIVEQYGENAMEVRESDSFMPVSMTIADADERYGKMIVEFQVPFTDSKLLFELSKSQNSEMFDFFCDFFNTIWERSSKNE